LRGKALYCAYYVNELLLRLLPAHTDCQEIFKLYFMVLNTLAECSAQQQMNDQPMIAAYETPLRFFELNLLELLGYGLNLTDEISSDQPIESDKKYFYISESGPCLTEVAGAKQIIITGQTLIDLHNRQFNGEKTLQEGKHLLKWVLNEHLGPQPLKSRELFKQLYR